MKGKRRRGHPGHQVRKMMGMLPRVKAAVAEKPRNTPGRARNQPSQRHDDFEDPFGRPPYSYGSLR